MGVIGRLGWASPGRYEGLGVRKLSKQKSKLRFYACFSNSNTEVITPASLKDMTGQRAKHRTKRLPPCPPAPYPGPAGPAWPTHLLRGTLTPEHSRKWVGGTTHKPMDSGGVSASANRTPNKAGPDKLPSNGRVVTWVPRVGFSLLVFHGGLSSGRVQHED